MQLGRTGAKLARFRREISTAPCNLLRLGSSNRETADFQRDAGSNGSEAQQAALAGICAAGTPAKVFETFCSELRSSSRSGRGEGQRGSMVSRLKQQLNIEDLRNHPAETVEKLRELLSADVPTQPDPRRKDFYEIEDGSRVFYIHISPLNGKVLLLATWSKDEKPEATMATSSQTA